jgi:hypothetical protein
LRCRIDRLDPDPLLIRCHRIVATADSQILDSTDRWFNLARHVIDAQIPGAHIVDLSDPPGQS